MKKILFLFVLGFALLSCGGNAKQETAAQTTQEAAVAKDGVEVLYFHGKQRCATCIAIEKHAREAVEAAFADAVKRGEVTFRIIDISQPENQALAEKYEVTWSSLFVVKHQGGKETAENLTEFAFGNARKSPDTFKDGVIAAVNKMLK